MTDINTACGTNVVKCGLSVSKDAAAAAAAAAAADDDDDDNKRLGSLSSLSTGTNRSAGSTRPATHNTPAPATGGDVIRHQSAADANHHPVTSSRVTRDLL